MILVVNKELCCGCGACSNICPKNCITMKSDAEGFLYPEINKEACIDCGLCEKTCPIHNTYTTILNDNPATYLGWSKDNDLMEKSTSGGVVSSVSVNFLKLGAYVCGAAYDSKNVVRHVIIHGRADLLKLTRSKYVQSDMGTVYTDIQRLLLKEKDVLFTGTGCQVYGLLSYLAVKKIPTKHLYTVDVVCHGTPSPKLLKEYIKYWEETSQKKVVSVSMREKQHPKPFFSNPYTQVNFADRSFHREAAGSDYYGRFFLGEISSRPSCYNCQFKTIGRMSDITVGDCWFSRSITGRKNIPFDVTLCLVHSKKGEEILKDAEINLVKVDTEKAIRCNGGMIYSSATPHPKRIEFFQRLGKDKLNEIAEDYFPVMRKKHDLKWLIKEILKIIPGVYEKYYFDNKHIEFENRIKRSIPKSARVRKEIRL